jgi:hypothetical protein
MGKMNKDSKQKFFEYIDNAKKKVEKSKKNDLRRSLSNLQNKGISQDGPG